MRADWYKENPQKKKIMSAVIDKDVEQSKQ